MKKVVLLVATIGLIVLIGPWVIDMYKFAGGVKKDAVRLNRFMIEKEIQDGDIIFQTSLSGQSKAIQLATNSVYSHCGLIFKHPKDSLNWYVLEAVQPVKWTKLHDWIDRGKDNHYVIRRVVSDQPLPYPTLRKVMASAEKHLSKPYDLTFEWNDERMYCSELIWKAYKEATGLSVGKLQILSDFDLSDEMVNQKLKERYGQSIPLQDTVISPQAIFESPLLETVKSN